MLSHDGQQKKVKKNCVVRMNLLRNDVKHGHTKPNRCNHLKTYMYRYLQCLHVWICTERKFIKKRQIGASDKRLYLYRRES